MQPEEKMFPNMQMHTGYTLPLCRSSKDLKTLNLMLSCSDTLLQNVEFFEVEVFLFKGSSPRLPPPLTSLLLQLPHSQNRPIYPRNKNAFQ